MFVFCDLFTSSLFSFLVFILHFMWGEGSAFLKWKSLFWTRLCAGCIFLINSWTYFSFYMASHWLHFRINYLFTLEVLLVKYLFNPQEIHVHFTWSLPLEVLLVKYLLTSKLVWYEFSFSFVEVYISELIHCLFCYFSESWSNSILITTHFSFMKEILN